MMTTAGRHRAGSSTPSARARRNPRLRIVALVALVVAVVLAVVAAGFAFASPSVEYTTGPTIVSDEFERTGAGSLGIAPVGGDYALSVPSAFSTDGTVAMAAPPRSGSSVTATLPAVTADNVVAQTTASVAELPSAGNGLSFGLQLRSGGGSHYVASARLDGKGSVWLTVLRVVGSTATQVALARDVPATTGLVAGTPVHLETEVTGTDPVQVRARAWKEGDERPDWQVVTEDSDELRIVAPGSIGLWTYVSTGSAPVPVAYDGVTAQLLVSATAPPEETPAPPDTTPVVEGVRGTPGAGPVGSAAYPVPDDAIYVSTDGVDGAQAARGTAAAPFATIAAAIAAAPSGSTIVLRAGEYHGSVVMPSHKTLTLQSYPGEEVWLDGSRVVSTWTADGATWVSDGWNVAFDASPTYSRGAPDGTTPGWRFVDPLYPMAAHPDQVWIDDIAQLQVGSRAEVVTGTFFVDAAAQQLVLGSDPSDAVVRASDTAKALVIAGPNSTVRGIGVSRFAPSVPDIGAVAVSASDVTIEEVTIVDTATTGLALFAIDTTLNRLTIQRSGMLGAQASWSDGLVATNLLISDNNTEHFNRAPVSGGFKIHKSRGVTVADSAFLSNRGNALWFDESVYDMTVTGNDILDNVGNGIVIELSATAIVADNVVMRSERDGILISDSGHVDIWNNTIVANDRGVNITQGTRRASELGLPGHDSRQKLPDPTVTWITEDVSVVNNVIAEGRGKCILCVEDYSHERSASQMDVRSNGNVLQRVSISQPKWAVVWSRGAGNPAVYLDVASFSMATGQDSTSLALDGTPAVENGVLTPEVSSLVSAVAKPLVPAIAAAVGQPEGEKHLGAWTD